MAASNSMATIIAFSPTSLTISNKMGVANEAVCVGKQVRAVSPNIGSCEKRAHSLALAVQVFSGKATRLSYIATAEAPKERYGCQGTRDSKASRMADEALANVRIAMGVGGVREAGSRVFRRSAGAAVTIGLTRLTFRLFILTILRRCRNFCSVTMARSRTTMAAISLTLKNVTVWCVAVRAVSV